MSRCWRSTWGLVAVRFLRLLRVVWVLRLTAYVSEYQVIGPTTTRTCHECLTEGHMADANFCRHCGARLPLYAQDAANA
jgi:hypothetical protein